MLILPVPTVTGLSQPEQAMHNAWPYCQLAHVDVETCCTAAKDFVMIGCLLADTSPHVSQLNRLNEMPYRRSQRWLWLCTAPPCTIL